MEIMPGLSRYFTAEHVGRLVLEREVSDSATVRDLLEEIASENRGFGEALFNARTGNLARHISIILNGRFYELSGGLAARLMPGDTVRVMLAFTGG